MGGVKKGKGFGSSIGAASPSTQFQPTITRRNPIASHERVEAVHKCFDELAKTNITSVGWNFIRGWCLSHLRVTITEMQLIYAIQRLRRDGFHKNIHTHKG